MGKRKHSDYDEEEYLERKIRRLERRRSKMRHRRRSHSYSRSRSRLRERDYMEEQVHTGECPGHEDSEYEESPSHGNAVIDFVDDPEDLTDTAAAGIQSVVVEPVASTSRAPTLVAPEPRSAPAPAPVSALAAAPAPSPAPASLHEGSVVGQAAPSTSEQPVAELEPSILCLLGDEPVQEERLGPCVHRDIASRWSDILINGLKDEVLNEITKQYVTPDNLTLAQAPVINPEIKAACIESTLKRDSILSEKQKLIGKVITGVANTMSTLLSTDQNEDNRNQIIKSLSDTGRLLCHLHSSETQTRRLFILTGLNKEVKDNIKDLKRDSLLFGKDLQEGLKSMKAISRTGAELRPNVNRPRPPPSNRHVEPNTSRALNWRGQPPPAVRPPPRRNHASASTARGARRPGPPPPPSRAAQRRRAPPPPPPPPAYSRGPRR